MPVLQTMDSNERAFRRATGSRFIEHKLVIEALLICLGIGPYAPLLAQPIINPVQVWGPTSNGVRMALSAVRTVNASWHDVEFDLALRNAGSMDVVLNLGFMLSNGKQQHPAAVRLTLRDSKGVAREFDYSSGLGVVAGRMDDFLVALPAGATYVLRFNLEPFCCQTQQVKLKTGRRSSSS